MIIAKYGRCEELVRTENLSGMTCFRSLEFASRAFVFFFPSAQRTTLAQECMRWAMGASGASMGPERPCAISFLS